MSNLLLRFRSWLKDESGAYAVYAALTFPILLGMTGFGLDYYKTLSIKARFDTASDTAAIAGSKAAVAYVVANPEHLTGEALHSAAMRAGATAATQAFNANASSALEATPVTPNVRMAFENNSYITNVTYNSTNPTTIGGLLGFSSIAVTGAATAVEIPPTFINIYVLVDASQSMGIAANQAEMDKLYKATAVYNADGPGIGCVFGCHVMQGFGQSLEEVAHANGIMLRIDVARAGVYNMGKLALANAPLGEINFSVYQIQRDPATLSYVNQVYQTNPSDPAEKKYNALMAAMSPTSTTLDLGENNLGGTGDSAQGTSIEYFAQNILPSSGDGSSADTPVNYVFIITDGMLDTPGACAYGHCTGAVPASACDTLKAKGASVGAIYTTYVDIYTQNNPALGIDARFRDLVAPTLASVPVNLRACSSGVSSTGASWYYEASDDSALLNSMSGLFKSAISQVRLTN